MTISGYLKLLLLKRYILGVKITIQELQVMFYSLFEIPAYGR